MDWKGCKGSGCSQIGCSVAQFACEDGGKNMKEISDCESFRGDLNLSPPEYKAETLLHTQTYYEI